MELLIKSSQNIALMIETVKLHEQTIALWTKHHYRDLSMNENKESEIKFNPSKTPMEADVFMKERMKANTFIECIYGSIFNPEHNTCFMSNCVFNHQDVVVLVKECNHIFSRDHFYHWARYHNHCPRCKHVLL